MTVEIAASSASLDLGDKRLAYCRNQVREYLVWRVYDQALDWFYLQEGQYVLLEPNSGGILCSPHFPGLWLDRTALLKGNLGRVLSTLPINLTRD